jgi:hypothetical protein
LIKTLFKLALLAACANATWHLFVVYSAHYKLKDGVTYAAQYRGEMTTDDQIRERVLELAAQLDVPVETNVLSIKHELKHTIVHTSYVRPVELLPGFIYQWPFTLNVDTYTIPPPQEGLPGPKK